MSAGRQIIDGTREIGKKTRIGKSGRRSLEKKVSWGGKKETFRMLRIHKRSSC
ncbi:hypothetical protein NC99_05600 [Sunxiuqinia dokdonensis]|uniref:Uncharacterized protein n=1 Tax=Sunxiuqinia dokdonensis TaxID=1409788 RepID=A0A0L8VDY7_9BACT|nr:hypothetical protein NC99_05600 [Sunxiuqinia dokdonensis]